MNSNDAIFPAITFTCPEYPDEELIRPCECDECLHSKNVYLMGACDEDNPTCGDCFLCEVKADNDHWWAVNRADVLQI